MPIYYEKESNTWFAKDLNDDERESLMRIAANVITSMFGEQLAEKIMNKIIPNMSLEDTPPEQMYSA